MAAACIDVRPLPARRQGRMERYRAEMLGKPDARIPLEPGTAAVGPSANRKQRSNDAVRY
jgi:hypothetical protein